MIPFLTQNRLLFHSIFLLIKQVCGDLALSQAEGELVSAVLHFFYRYFVQPGFYYPLQREVNRHLALGFPGLGIIQTQHHSISVCTGSKGAVADGVVSGNGQQTFCRRKLRLGVLYKGGFDPRRQHVLYPLQGAEGVLLPQRHHRKMEGELSGQLAVRLAVGVYSLKESAEHGHCQGTVGECSGLVQSACRDHRKALSGAVTLCYNAPVNIFIFVRLIVIVGGSVPSHRELRHAKGLGHEIGIALEAGGEYHTQAVVAGEIVHLSLHFHIPAAGFQGDAGGNLQHFGLFTIVDHSIQFVFDCYKYYLASGDLDCLQKPMKAFKKLIAFLMETCKGGLYPTDDRNSGFVWLDHEAYEPGNSPSKECGINLYIAGMIQKAYLPLCKIFGYPYEEMQPIQAFAESLLQQVTEKYWCDADGVFYDNLPYVSDPKERKVADRTLAMAVLFDFCKGNDTAKSIELLKGGNPAMKLSYPANAVWRMWALAKAEALEPFVEELWSVWAKMPSVLQNNTYQEFWTAYPDSCSEWSHIPAAPLLCIYEGVLGLRCNNVEGNRLSFKPQLKGFCSFETKIYNHGQEVMVRVVKQDRNRFLLSVRGENTEISITPPRGCHMVTLSSQEFQLEYQ